MSRRVPWLMLLAMFPLASCDGGEASDQGGAATTAEPPDVEVVATDPQLWGAAEQADFFRWAEDVLLSECMAEAGFEFAARIGPEAPAPEPPLFGLDDVDVARELGFAGVDLDPDENAPGNDPNWVYLQELTPEDQARYQTALYGPESAYFELQVEGYGEVGIPGTGCLAESQQLIYGDLESWMALHYWDLAVESRAYELVVADPAFAEALSVWSACMEGRGFEAADPGELRESVSEAIGAEGAHSDTAQDTEVEAAVAEAECAQESGHVAVGTELLDEAIAGIRADEADQDLAFEERSRAAIAAATAILEPHVPGDLLASVPFATG